MIARHRVSILQRPAIRTFTWARWPRATCPCACSAPWASPSTLPPGAGIKHRPGPLPVVDTVQTRPGHHDLAAPMTSPARRPSRPPAYADVVDNKGKPVPWRRRFGRAQAWPGIIFVGATPRATGAVQSQIPGAITGAARAKIKTATLILAHRRFSCLRPSPLYDGDWSPRWSATVRSGVRGVGRRMRFRDRPCAPSSRSRAEAPGPELRKHVNSSVVPSVPCPPRKSATDSCLKPARENHAAAFTRLRRAAPSRAIPPSRTSRFSLSSEGRVGRCSSLVARGSLTRILYFPGRRRVRRGGRGRRLPAARGAILLSAWVDAQREGVPGRIPQ